MHMRRIAALAIVWTCVVPAVSSGQSSWREFVSKEDRFGANFPGEPVVSQITWRSEHGASVPARVYSATLGPGKYSVTVVDYNLVKDQLIEKSKSCPPGTERCLGQTAFSGDGYWKNDLRGAMVYAAFQFLKRDIKLTHYHWSHLGQGVEVNELQFINNPDQTRTFVSIYMHHNVLYVMEGTVPLQSPPPGLFTQSIVLYEADGTRTNHGRVVFNGAEVEPNEVYVGAEGRVENTPSR
jgi:hypothetical protein